MSGSNTLTTKEVARLCRVSDATVKRWDDAGLLKSERTNGGHRRFRAADVARFQREQELGVKNCPGDESVFTALKMRRECRISSGSQLFKSLVTGREEEVAEIIINAYLNDKSPAKIFDTLISREMCRIGELWLEGKLTIAEEHLATKSVSCSLHKLRSVLPVPEPCGKTAICCTTEGDFHELPTHFVQLILESEGWEVVNFGANLPIYSLCEEVSNLSPDLICISSTIMTDCERLSRDYAEFMCAASKQNIPIILGGNAFEDEQIRQRFPARLYPKTFAEVDKFAKTLL